MIKTNSKRMREKKKCAPSFRYNTIMGTAWLLVFTIK